MLKISQETLRFLRIAARHQTIPSHCYKSYSSTSSSNNSNNNRNPISTSSSSPIDPTTHYSLFRSSIPQGPPPTGRFDIDLGALKHEFLRLQARFHPDRAAGADRTQAAAMSARINEAYKTLQDPLRRAQYLLGTMGGDGDGEDGKGAQSAEGEHDDDDSDNDERIFGDAPSDQELLMEVMEAREEAEEAEAMGGQEVERLREVNRGRIEDVLKRLGVAFEQDDLQAARKETVRLRYWVGVEERLKEGSNMH